MTTAENRLRGGQRSVIMTPPPRGALTRRSGTVRQSLIFCACTCMHVFPLVWAFKLVIVSTTSLHFGCKIRCVRTCAPTANNSGCMHSEFTHVPNGPTPVQRSARGVHGCPQNMSVSTKEYVNSIRLMLVGALVRFLT